MNPMMLLQAKQRMDMFKNDHPKMIQFFRHLKKDILSEGAVFEIKVTDPTGNEHVSNIRMNANDAETIRMIMEALGGDENA